MHHKIRANKHDSTRKSAIVVLLEKHFGQQHQEGGQRDPANLKCAHMCVSVLTNSHEQAATFAAFGLSQRQTLADGDETARRVQARKRR